MGLFFEGMEHTQFINVDIERIPYDQALWLMANDELSFDDLRCYQYLNADPTSDAAQIETLLKDNHRRELAAHAYRDLETGERYITYGYAYKTRAKHAKYWLNQFLQSDNDLIVIYETFDKHNIAHMTHESAALSYQIYRNMTEFFEWFMRIDTAYGVLLSTTDQTGGRYYIIATSDSATRRVIKYMVAQYNSSGEDAKVFWSSMLSRFGAYYTEEVLRERHNPDIQVGGAWISYYGIVANKYRACIKNTRDNAISWFILDFIDCRNEDYHDRYMKHYISALSTINSLRTMLMDGLYNEAITAMGYPELTQESATGMLPKVKYLMRQIKSLVPMFGTGKEIHDFLIRVFQMYPMLSVSYFMDDARVGEFKKTVDLDKYQDDAKQYKAAFKNGEICQEDIIPSALNVVNRNVYYGAMGESKKEDN